MNVAGETGPSSPLPLVIKQTEEATQVLTGLASWQAWLLTKWPADVDLELTGGGLGGCRWVWARAGASGDVRLTYSDRSISSWGTQEPMSETREEPEGPAHEAQTADSNYMKHGWKHTGWGHLRRLQQGETWGEEHGGNSPTVSTITILKFQGFSFHICQINVKKKYVCAVTPNIRVSTNMFKPRKLLGLSKCLWKTQFPDLRWLVNFKTYFLFINKNKQSHKLLTSDTVWAPYGSDQGLRRWERKEKSKT